ncbi:hypothetical protein, partial [Escherichia coli]|uniref:hypothetical protein n=1 Tax=Escherichia coli TaxID=562 RepID=UPI0032DAA5D5
VLSVPTLVLFDSGASNSFISSKLVREHIFEGVPIKIKKVTFPSDLIQFDLDDFGVVLGMDWLGQYKAQILCSEQKVVLKGPGGKRVSYRGVTKEPEVRLVSMIKIKKYVAKGHEAFLCAVEDLSAPKDEVQQIPIVREFPDVFPEEIPGLPPPREVEFTIDLMPGTAPISKAPYRMAPKEMQELKEQLQDLLNKG